MSAQPIEGRPFVPQTVAEIRAALPEDQHEQFDADLAAATAFEVRGVMDEWWARALLSDQMAGIEASFANIRAGGVALVPAGEVVPGWRQ